MTVPLLGPIEYRVDILNFIDLLNVDLERLLMIKGSKSLEIMLGVELSC